MSESDEDAGMCVAAYGCKRYASIGYLCRGHFERLAAILRDIEDESAILSAVPSMQQRVGSGKGSLASERAPARLDVLVHTDWRSWRGRRLTGPTCPECWHDTCVDIRRWVDAFDAQASETLSVLNVLHSWARVVREERGFADRQQITVTGERDLLSRQLEFIAGQDWVDEFYGDCSRLLGQLRAANGTTPEKPAGRCYLPVNGEVCGGPIWVDMAAGHAYCGRCRQTWDGERIVLLKWELEEQRREAARPRTDDGRLMLTAEELVARGAVTSVSNVRVSAHRQGRVSVDGHYDPEWFAKVSA